MKLEIFFLFANVAAFFDNGGFFDDLGEMETEKSKL